MSVWGGRAWWGSSTWNDGKTKFSRDFSISGATPTVSFPTRVSTRFVATPIVVAGSISTLTKIAFSALRASSVVSFFAARAAYLSAVMASFAGTLGRKIRVTLSAAMSFGYGIGGYGTGIYGELVSLQFTVFKQFAATASTVTVAFTKTLVVALVKFSTAASALVASLKMTASVKFTAAMSSMRPFAYGLIRKLKVFGGR